MNAGAIHHTSTEKRHTPIDQIMRQIERDYNAGRIGVTDTGELIPLTNIYQDMYRDTPGADYHIGPTREIDREYQRNCKHCGTSYRSSEQRDETRCPFCWRLV